MSRKPVRRQTKPRPTNRGRRPSSPAWKRHDDRAARTEAARSGLESLRSFLYRYRWQLAPVYGGLGAYVLAAAAHRVLTPGLSVLITLLGAAAGIGVSWKEFPRKSERIYSTAVVVAAAAWLIPAAIVGPKVRPLPGLLLVATLAAAVPWWAHRRVRDHIKVDRQVEAWPEIAEAAGIAGAKLRRVVPNKNGWSGVLQLKRGQTADDVINNVGKLESAMQVRPNAIRTSRDRTAAHRIKITVVETDVFGAVGEIPHPATIDQGWAPASRSIMDVCELGRREDGELGGVRIVDKNGAHHALVAGQKGSGKSGVLSVIMGHIAACSDALMIGIDLHKGGLAFGPWESCMYFIATTMEQAKAVTAALNEIITDRAEQLRKEGKSDKVTPSPDLPALGMIIDEGAKMLGTDDIDAVLGVRDVVQGGRASAVFGIIATQRPTLSSLGDGDLRAQLDINIGLKMRAKGDVRFVFPDNFHEFDTSLFELPGMLYLEHEDSDPTPHRSFALYHPPVIRKVAEQLAPGRPQPDARAKAILEKHLGKWLTDAPAAPQTEAAASTSTPDLSTREGRIAANAARRAGFARELEETLDEAEAGDETPAVALTDLHRTTPIDDASTLPVDEVLAELRARKLEVDEVDATIVAEVRRLGAEGARMHHLVAATQRHRSRVYERVPQLEAAGVIVKTKPGLWISPAATQSAA